MFKTDVDARTLVAELDELEKRQFPYALAKALNDTAFQDVRGGWRDEMLQVFDRPTRITLNAVLVNRANRKQQPAPVAEIYIRDEASGGTPPVRWLVHGVEGGSRKHKPFENLLIRAGIMSPTEFAVPGRSYPLDAHGNVPGSVVKAITADVRLARGEDTSHFSTPESRRRRERRRNKRGGLYFASRGDRLPRGIYERIRTAFGVAVRTVFIFVSRVSYSPRFDAYDVARELFNRNFPRRFDEAMRHAVRTAKQKGRSGSRGRRG